MKKIKYLLASLGLLVSVAVASYTGAFAASPIALGGSIFPLTLISTSPINLTDGFNEMLMLLNQQVVGISTVYTGTASIPPAGVDTSGVTFSTSIQGNPLVQQTYQDVLVSTSLSSTALTTIIASEAGRTIVPTAAITIMASGTPASATGFALECGNGALIASWPVAELVTNTPTGLYASTAGPALGSALTRGCPASNGVYLSNVGTFVTTATHIYVNFPYTVQ